MRIALVGPSYPFKGGIPQHTTLLYRRLARDHEVLFISYRRQYPDWLYPGQGDRDDSHRELQEDSAKPLIDSLNPFSWRRARREICRFKPDVVILPWWVMYWSLPYIYLIHALRSRLESVRILFLCHNVTAHEPGPLSRFLTRQTLRLGDGFTVHSEQDREVLEGIREKGDIVRMELPCYPVPKADATRRAQTRERLGLEGDVLLFFGFIRPYKGVRYLLDAMKTVLEQRDCTLLIVGEVWGEVSDYEEQIEALGIRERVRLIDQYVPQEQVADFFVASDLVVLPYLMATGSAVAKLAYSYHLPVVVSDVGSLPDSILPGETGYIVPAGDAGKLAEAILSYLQNADRDAMARAIAGHIQHFGWDQLVEAVERLGASSRDTTA